MAGVVACLLLASALALTNAAKLITFPDFQPSFNAPSSPFDVKPKDDSTAPLPPGFVVGAKFQPPQLATSVLTPSSQNINLGLDASRGLFAGNDIPGCRKDTVVIEQTETVEFPVTKFRLVTTTVTTTLSQERRLTSITTATITLTDYMLFTNYLTTFTKIPRTALQTVYAPPLTYVSTATLLTTEFYTQPVTKTLINSLVEEKIKFEPSTVTEYITFTNFQEVIHTEVASVHGGYYTVTKTVTLAEEAPVLLPPQTKYLSTTVRSVVNLQRTLRLPAETIVKSKTVVVPSYSMITNFVTKTRTSTAWTTAFLTKTDTYYETSSYVRVGVSQNTIYKFVSSTTTEIQYITTKSPVFEISSVTKDVPITTTRVTNVVVPTDIITTIPGQLVTDVITSISNTLLVETVTNTLPTPIDYTTTTSYINCRK